MRDETVPNTRARPRPVADLPLAALCARRGELARRWAIAEIMRRPLDQLAGVPLEEIAARGPQLLDAALTAVGSDAALAALAGDAAGPAPAASLPEICGTGDAAATAEAVESMRGVLGRALDEELVAAAPAELAAVADRLAHVCAAALATALRADAGAGAQRLPAPGHAAGYPPRVRAAAEDEGDVGAGPVPPNGLRSRDRATIVDEHAPASAPGEAPAGEPEPTAPSGEIAIRDERSEGPGAWIGAIGRQLERHARDRRPFAVLLVELIELDRVGAEESPAEAERLDTELERALAAELASAPDSSSALVRPPVTETLAAGAPAVATLTRERPGRYWMIAPASDRGGARRVADRIVSALGDWRSTAGLALSVVVGAAACPEDGREASALAAYADVDLYAARSAARARQTAGAGGRAI